LGTTQAADQQKNSDKVMSALSSIAAKKNIEAAMQNKISISIGNWFKLDNVVISNVQHTLKHTTPAPNGGVMGATVQVSFAPVFTLTSADVKDMLQI
jgi:hypothetical protein